MNKAILMGRLTRDPELRYTQNNIPVCTFTLAVDREYTPEGQEKQADFIPIVVWQNKGEAAAKYLEKGRRICVVGRIQTRTWDDDNGVKRYVTEVISENWYFADDKKKENTEIPQTQQSSTPPQQPSKPDDVPPWM